MEILLALLVGWWDWRVARSGPFTIIYPPGYEWEAGQTLGRLERYRTTVDRLTGNSVRTLPVVIEDLGMNSAGLADPVFFKLRLSNYPPGPGFVLEGIEDWYRSVTVHEYTHIASMSRTAGLSTPLTAVFGRLFQPNIYAPAWLIEGFAVYSESRLSPYEGRLNDGYFDACIRERTAGGRFPSIVEATNEPFSFPGGKAYIFGGEFCSFLAGRYGPERFREFFRIAGSCPWQPVGAILPCLGPDAAARRVFGNSFPGLFAEWRLHEQARSQPGARQARKITDLGWYIHSLIEHDNVLYFVHVEPVKTNVFAARTAVRIMAYDINTATIRVLARLTSPVASPLRIQNGVLYFITDAIRPARNVSANGLGLTSVLYRMNLATGASSPLCRDDIRAFGLLPDGSVIYARDRRHGFGSEIWRWADGKKHLIGESDLLVNEIDAGASAVIMVARSSGENWNIYEYTGDLRPLVESPWVEGSINLKDQCLIFTANHDGLPSLYLYDLSEREYHRLAGGTGYENYGEIVGDTVYFIGLGVNGNDIYQRPVSTERPALPDAPRRCAPEYAGALKNGGSSDIAATLLPAIRLPYLFPADKTLRHWIYGGIIAGQDAVGENTYLIAAGYRRFDRRPVIRADYEARIFTPVTLSAHYDFADVSSYQAAYPFYNRLDPGLANITLFLTGTVAPDNRRKELSPAVSVAWRIPDTRITVAGQVSMEDRWTGSPLQRRGQFFRGRVSRTLRGGELLFDLRGFHDPQNPDTPVVAVPGWPTGQPAPAALVYRIEYTHRAIAIRRGAWNPNVYFEDLFYSCYQEVGITNRNYRACLGLELTLEVKCGFGFLPLAPVLGIAVGEHFRPLPYFSLRTFFPYNFGRNGKMLDLIN